MRKIRLYISSGMVLRMILRKRIIPLLLIVIPSAFFYMVYLTTSERIMPFEVASIADKLILQVSERNSSFVFFAVATVGFLSSYIGLSLIQEMVDVNKRLIICGYHPIELMGSSFLVLLVVIIFVSTYISLSMLLFFTPVSFAGFFISMVMSGLTYGCYGLLIGSVFKGELEGILLIVLLANIDAGWLQNPLFYSGAQNKMIIQVLPAYYPSQMAIVSAFSSYSTTKILFGSIAYFCSFGALAATIYYQKMKKK
ncbi:hypothetical protein [uncultured Carboxylicivirga sp.]|nr:hypothetical protein [uncultured Carboxylicivirga sp.]TRX71944.1 hypothetical protein FNN09_04805 [Carboxylicivirga sp. M1479]